MKRVVEFVLFFLAGIQIGDILLWVVRRVI